MTIYETIKAAISVKQAAEHYGLKVNRNGMACCPFHNDMYWTILFTWVKSPMADAEQKRSKEQETKCT